MPEKYLLDLFVVMMPLSFFLKDEKILTSSVVAVNVRTPVPK